MACYPQPGNDGQSGQDGMYVDAYTQGLMYEAMKDMDRQRAVEMAHRSGDGQRCYGG